MIDKKKAARLVFGTAFLTTLMGTATAYAAAATTGPVDWRVSAAKAMASGLAMSVSALAAGYAQAKIGSAGAGTLAERPEVSIWVITLQALPEVIVLLGFVSAIMISG
jgi:V/A-type H+/Na+-transporting ATPase subunit K